MGYNSQNDRPGRYKEQLETIQDLKEIKVDDSMNNEI